MDPHSLSMCMSVWAYSYCAFAHVSARMRSGLSPSLYFTRAFLCQWLIYKTHIPYISSQQSHGVTGCTLSHSWPALISLMHALHIWIVFSKLNQFSINPEVFSATSTSINSCWFDKMVTESWLSEIVFTHTSPTSGLIIELIFHKLFYRKKATSNFSLLW